MVDMRTFDTDDFLFNGKGKFKINSVPTKIDDFYENKEEYESAMNQLHESMDKHQGKLYADNKYGILVIFQAMDAAGKDGTVRHVFTGVNPMALRTVSFKRPSEKELKHDFLWRSVLEMPERGMITIFNRSYYEEVLVVKVHPEILDNVQKLPPKLIEDKKELFEKRYEDLVNYERYLGHNGFLVLKFFLNVSKQEQGKRLIERIEDPSKNWKFEEQDIKERESWDDYQKAYQEMINQTSTQKCPWYIIPADDKKNMRLIVTTIIVEKLKSLDLAYPETSEARQNELKKFISKIQEQDKLD